MAQLHETQMGQKFFMKDIPSLIKSINRLADAMEHQQSTENKYNSISINVDKNKHIDVQKEIETELRRLQFMDKSREWSEYVIDVLIDTNTIKNRCIQDEQCIDQDIMITAFMEIIFKNFG